MKKRILAILMAAIMCCLQLAEFVPAEKVKAAYSVSEEDIYYRCPEYLDNKAYDNYMARYRNWQARRELDRAPKTN